MISIRSASMCKARFSMTVFIVLSGIITVSAPLMADNAAKLNNRGIKAYDDNDQEESVRQFTEALVERPDTPELLFNRGTALSASGQTEEALRELQRAASATENSELGAAAHFNAGNAFITSGQIEQAVDEYKQAVMLDQSSEEYRKNLELVLRQQQQQNNEGEEQQSEQNQNTDEEQDQNSSDEDTESQEQQDQQQQNNQQQQQQNEQSGDQEQPKPSEATEERPMSPDEAERILDAIENEEEQALELRRMQIQETMRQGDDW